MAEYRMKLSVVVPVFNEEQNIPVLFAELKDTLQSLVDHFDVLFVDDGSEDRSFDEIRRLSESGEPVRGLSLSRNFGHQAALLAGLERATGEVVITMDGDLQHPASVIPLLLRKHAEGYRVVNTRRTKEGQPGIMKRLSSRWFYRMLNLLSDVRIIESSSDFRLMDRQALDAFLLFRERARFNRGLVSWMGFPQTTVDYLPTARISGKSKYSFRKMRTLAMDGVLSFSSRPLRLSTYLGLLTILAGIIYSVVILSQYLRGNTVTGWASLIMVVLILGGVQLLSLGIIGEYLARVFNESKGRPLYIIKDEIR